MTKREAIEIKVCYSVTNPRKGLFLKNREGNSTCRSEKVGLEVRKSQAYRDEFQSADYAVTG
jgi:hypothetical protein